MILVNMMRTDVHIETPDGQVTIPASGRVATVLELPQPTRHMEVDGVGTIPVVEVEASVIGMPPDSHPDVGYLVTYKALNTLHAMGLDTSDIYAPDVLIKDDSGRVTGCRQLMQLRSGESRDK